MCTMPFTVAPWVAEVDAEICDDPELGVLHHLGAFAFGLERVATRWLAPR